MELVFKVGLLIFGVAIFGGLAKFGLRQTPGAGPGQPVQPLNGAFDVVGQAMGTAGQMLLAVVGVVAGIVAVGLVGFVLFKLIVRGLEKPQLHIPLQVSTAVVRPFPPCAGTEAVCLKVELPPPSRQEVKADLIEQLRAIDWFQFEKIVALTYQKLGYSVTRRGGANPDDGIDLVIEKGGERAAVQCKQWRTWDVKKGTVMGFLGALTHSGIKKGILVTLGGCTGDAKQLADAHGIEFVNEAGLARMLEGTNARFDPEVLEILQDKRKFCPKCEQEMILRIGKKGLGAGKTFWGCSTYPRCHFKMAAE
jgi:hypothetical protein